MNINIVLSNDQDGYSAIREHIIEHWNTNGYATAVVRLATSYNGREYSEDNQIVSPYWGKDGDVTIEHDNDWWEGEKYIKILEIKNLHEIDICADVVEVRHGQIKWVNRPISAQYATVTDEYGENHYGKVCDRIENNPVGYCGECGKRLDDTFMNYCPNCGTKMDGERREG